MIKQVEAEINERIQTRLDDDHQGQDDGEQQSMADLVNEIIAQYPMLKVYGTSGYSNRFKNYRHLYLPIKLTN